MVCGRQEVRQVEGGAQLPPWEAVVDGGVGNSLLNSYHFLKVTPEQQLLLHHPRDTSTLEMHKLQVSLITFCSPSYIPQGSLKTPVGLRFTAGGEAHSAVIGQESVEATLMLSAGQDNHVHYLLAWEMDLQTRNTTNSTTNSKSVAIYIFSRPGNL